MFPNKFLQTFLLVLLLPWTLAAQQETQELKRSFIGIELGQNLEEFRAQVSRQGEGEASEASYYFLYDLYSSEIEEGGRNETLIEIKGNGFIEKGVFQFAGFEGEPQLVAITIFLSPEWNSYDQFFVTLSNNYGNPSRMNPQRSVWENEQTIITLEKNLRYKILDKEYLRKLQELEQKEFDLYGYSYEEFLKKF